MYIFCNRHDEVAFALYKSLKVRNANIYIITAEEFIHAKKWSHYIDENGNAATQITLQNGHVIFSEQIDGVFNRIRHFMMPHFGGQIDRMYAETEFYALWVSFLKGINDVLIEKIETRYLSLDEENQWVYLQQASTVGIPVMNCQMTSSPKWKGTPSFTPFHPGNNIVQVANESKQDLLWENKPVLLLEKYTEIAKVVIIGSKVFSTALINCKNEILKFSEKINRIFFEMYFARAAEEWKFSSINLYPVSIHEVESTALAEVFIQKIKTRK